MNQIRIATLFLFVWLGTHETIFAQQCPTSVGFATFCPFAGTGFFMHGVYPDPQATSAEITFDGGDPACNTTINLTITSCNWGHFYADNIAPYCEDQNPTGTVKFNTGVECVYIDGDLVPCNDLVTVCKDPLIEFAKDLVSDPPNCKLWEGPCATESEIWRNGTVNIGTTSALGGFKLGVQGGIITEMLQICKPEWCDYVFDDSFNLMPLEEVRHFIKTSGHLPDCTPAETISYDGGFMVDEEAIRQQKKIEEIFLHLIAAQHRLDRIKNRVKSTGLAVNLDPHIKEYSGSEYSDKEMGALIQIECFQIKPAPAGIGGVSIHNANGPFNLMWNGPNSGSMSNIPCLDGAIRIHNLIAGQYNVVVSNASGFLGTCSFTISSGGSSSICNNLSNSFCKQAILDMLTDEAFDTPSDCKQWEGDPCSHDGKIYRLGNVCIGTNVGRAGYSLAVKGGIIADKFRVELCENQGWCDYVFDEGYSLMTLPDLESYLKTNKHLPGTISQGEVTKNGGFEMRSVKIDHQTKIEEAFLHLIELNKTNKALKQKIDLLTQNN
jgi:hypothetical protein